MYGPERTLEGYEIGRKNEKRGGTKSRVRKDFQSGFVLFKAQLEEHLLGI